MRDSERQYLYLSNNANPYLEKEYLDKATSLYDKSQQLQNGCSNNNGNNGTKVNSSTTLNGMNITYYPSDNFTFEGFEIKNVTSGNWTVNITPANVTEKLNYTVITSLKTNLTVSISSNKYNYDFGEQINFTANLTYFNSSVENYSINSKIVRPDGKIENITLNKFNSSSG